MKESLTHYLSNKRIHQFRGNSYYKVKNYKSNYFVEQDVIVRLSSGPQEVSLEKNALSSPAKGMIKWDNLQKKVLVSESRHRLIYEPFNIE